MFTDKDKQKLSLQKKEKRASKFGDFIVIGFVIRYIDSDASLVNFLRLNRASNEQLTIQVYKQALLKCEPQRLHIKRIIIWSNIMQIKDNTSDYSAIKTKVMENPELILNVEDVIMLDVQRSAHNMPAINSNMLTQVLKTYAFYNPEIEYCQGMNFIVGFLLMVFNDEETAFKALQSLVVRFRMADLFN